MDLYCAKRQRCGILCRRLSHKLVLHFGKEHTTMSFYTVLLRLLQCLSSRFAWPGIIRPQQKLTCADYPEVSPKPVPRVTSGKCCLTLSQMLRCFSETRFLTTASADNTLIGSDAASSVCCSVL